MSGRSGPGRAVKNVVDVVNVYELDYVHQMYSAKQKRNELVISKFVHMEPISSSTVENFTYCGR